MSPDISSILVTGDIVIDRHIYEGERSSLSEHSARGTHLVEEVGGAAITQRLIDSILEADLPERIALWEQALKKWENEAAKKAKQNPESRPSKPQKPLCLLACKLPEEIGSQWPERFISYAWWAPYPRANSKEKVWRLTKSFGYGPFDINSDSTTAEHFLQAADNLPDKPEIIVLDDADDRFRQKQNQALWHVPVDDGLAATKLPRWIILKLAGPIGQGDLWDHLMLCRPGDRLIVIVPANLLRDCNVRLSRGLSWERSVEHLLIGLRQNAALHSLSKARHLIVNFESDGALWIDFSRSEQTNGWLVFDAQHAEGEWGSQIKGEALGYLSCMTAAVVQTLVRQENKDNDPDFQLAMQRGLSAMRNLREEGHGIAVSDKGAFQLGLGFPAARLAREILQPTHHFAPAAIPESLLNEMPSSETERNRLPWSILASLHNPVVPERPLYGFARQLALRGEALLAHVPYLRVGKLLTAGRDEMEGLRSLRRIMQAFRDSDSAKKPLCIGVFGAPGSGKSFGVEQLALGIFGGEGQESYDGWMEFNLSQFDSSKDLIGAFHQVRDRALQQLIPVVFWDEFDSEQYHWLRYLLAPMQDGRFQEEKVTHTLGKCVFIFAGGTAETFEEFGPNEKDDEEQARHFALAKGPDFRSRLDGYFNVLGPNQRELSASTGATRPKDPMDIFFPVRRALIIRRALGYKADDKLDIDPGLLTALLEVSRYRHGARSLNKVLEPFKAGPARPKLRRWQMPGPNQLSLHVNPDDFYKACARDDPFKTDENIRKLAPAIHEVWREVAKREGWTPKYDMPYQDLPPDIKRSNEAAARRLPDIIALVGLQVVEGVATEPEEDEVRKHLARHLEALAGEEHNGWMAHLYSEGWQFAENRDDEKRRHNCLRPFNELRELDKDKDRDSVRHYPDFVREAGFKIVFS